MVLAPTPHLAFGKERRWWYLKLILSFHYVQSLSANLTKQRGSEMSHGGNNNNNCNQYDSNVCRLSGRR